MSYDEYVLDCISKGIEPVDECHRLVYMTLEEFYKDEERKGRQRAITRDENSWYRPNVERGQLYWKYYNAIQVTVGGLCRGCRRIQHGYFIGAYTD